VPSRRANGEGSIYFQDARQRYVGAVSLDDGKRKYVYGKTRKEVSKKLTAALQRRDQHLPFVDERKTLGAWLDYWLQQVIVADREPTTAAMYEIMVRKHIKPYLGALTLAKLQTEDIERWQTRLAEGGASLETRRSAMVRLRTALNLALKRGHVNRNVAALVDRPRVPKVKHQPPRVVELRRLLEVIEGDRNKALVYVALGASLRRAEVLGLQWSDVDLERRELIVRRRVNRVGKKLARYGGEEGGLIVRGGAKTDAGARTILLPQLVVDALEQQREYQRQDRRAAGARWIVGPQFVFTSEIGTVLDPRKVDLYFSSVRERAGLDGHTFHSLRHHFAGLLLAAGVPGRVVAEMMGHASYSVTANIYQHVPDELQRLAADRLDEMLGKLSSASGTDA
jgi:integrase